MENKIEPALQITPSSLSYYTSFEVLLNILNDDNLEQGIMVFWFSNPLQTNDKKEVCFFQEKVFKHSVGKEIRERFKAFEQNIGMPFTLSLSQIREFHPGYPFCEIPMWRMYGDNFKGVRLKFKYQKLKQYCRKTGYLDLVRCSYLTETKMDEEAKKVRNSIKDQGFTSELETVYKDSVLYKTYSWVYENEWRIVKWNQSINEIGIRSNGRLYLPMKIPLTLLESIDIGPKADFEAVEGSLNLILKKYNTTFKINKSKLQIGYV